LRYPAVGIRYKKIAPLSHKFKFRLIVHDS